MTPDQPKVYQPLHRERRFLSFLAGAGIAAAIVIVIGGALAWYMGLPGVCW
jgi:hypothetical protein